MDRKKEKIQTDRKKKKSYKKEDRQIGRHKKDRNSDKGQIAERDHRGIIFASLYTTIKKQNGWYLFIGAKSMP